MLESKGKEDYYMFRIPYWDRRRDKQTDNNSPFKSYRLGETVNRNGLPQVHGDFFLNNWQTVCWKNTVGICNSQIATGQLQRCPLEESCGSENELWPSDNDVRTVLSLQEYDTHPYTQKAALSFRNQLEGFKPLSDGDVQFCRENKLCACKLGEDDDYNCTEGDDGPQPEPIERLLHNSVHIILGLGYFGSDAQKNKSISGVMADVAASAYDPIFLNHHAMVDCIFETWLQNNPNAQYLIVTDKNEIPPGHHYDDYIVPFFLLYKHSEMFTTANNFGYRCIIESNQPSIDPHLFALFVLIIPIIILFIICIPICKYCCKRCKKEENNEQDAGSGEKEKPSNTIKVNPGGAEKDHLLKHNLDQTC